MARHREDPGQLHIDWTDATAQPTAAPAPSPAATPPPSPPTTDEDPPERSSAELVQRLPWDFRTTFPEPTPEAIEAGLITEDDLDPANIRSLHENHARHALFVLTELDAVLDARRRGVDPRNNKAPMLKEAKERLQQLFEAEPIRLQRWWQTLMETYEQAFGPEAADAFDKAIRAWHARIEVVADRAPASPPIAPRPTKPEEPTTVVAATKSTALFPGESKPPHRRISTRLPVPKPLPFRPGRERQANPTRAHEVREITEQHAEKLMGLLDGDNRSAPDSERWRMQEAFRTGIAAYAEDFGQRAAEQLEAYVRSQAALDVGSRRGR